MSDNERKMIVVASLVALVERRLTPDKKRAFSRDGEHFRRTERKRLEVLVYEPESNWAQSTLDLASPAAGIDKDDEDAVFGTFVVTGVGDIDGDGRDEIVVGVTRYSDRCYLKAARYEEGSWRSFSVAEYDPGEIDFMRSLSVGDVDGDGEAEIVVGTRPNGHVILIDHRDGNYEQTVLDRAAYGEGTTNTREVLVADADNDGELEVLAAVARSSPRPWAPTPGSIFMYSRTCDGWIRSVIDDHDGRTHSRMVVAGDVRNENRNALVSAEVGVADDEQDQIVRMPAVNLYDLDGDDVRKERIDVLDSAIKSRAFAVGDVDGGGANALVLGTRNLDERGDTYLYCYRYASGAGSWSRETIDVTGELGFHCIALVDVDGDGKKEIIASDDGRGLIKVYRRRGGEWESRIILDYPHCIFAVSFDVIFVDR